MSFSNPFQQQKVKEKHLQTWGNLTGRSEGDLDKGLFNNGNNGINGIAELPERMVGLLTQEQSSCTHTSPRDALTDGSWRPESRYGRTGTGKARAVPKSSIVVDVSDVTPAVAWSASIRNDDFQFSSPSKILLQCNTPVKSNLPDPTSSRKPPVPLNASPTKSKTNWPHFRGTPDFLRRRNYPKLPHQEDDKVGFRTPSPPRGESSLQLEAGY
jgi:hypothetical protein